MPASPLLKRLPETTKRFGSRARCVQVWGYWTPVEGGRWDTLEPRLPVEVVSLTSVGPKTCNRGEEWGNVVNACNILGLRMTKESICGSYEGEPPVQRLDFPLERWQALRKGMEPLPQTWWCCAKAQETGMMLAYRTVQYPQLENITESGAAKDHQIGQRYHVTYLNAAGRELARKFDMFLVDIELMFQKFWSTSDFLVDNHHLNRDANYQILNINLNLLRNAKRSSPHRRLASRAVKMS
ncbi:g2360 [Coccomyxa elongata]